MTTKKRIHIRDVAQHAGVSVGTVSNVLNSRGTVAHHLVEQVRRSIEELNYVPNDNARRLKSRSTDAIGLLVLSSFNSFFSSLAEAAEDEADAHGLSLLLAASAQKPEREVKYLEVFERQRVGAVLLAPIDGVSAPARAMRERGTSIILLGETPVEHDFCSVSADTELGGYLAGLHLLAQGRRRLLCVGGPRHQVRDRVAGAQRAVAGRANIEIGYLATADLTVAEGERAAQSILERPADERPDGIFALNDLVAIGMLNRLQQTSDLHVPRDISLIGHDDVEFAAMAPVPLTTIRQPVRQIAEAAMELALAEIGDGIVHTHRERSFPPELVIRGTSLAT